MINFNDGASENNTEHNPNSTNILDHPYGISNTGGSGSGKTNAMVY